MFIICQDSTAKKLEPFCVYLNEIYIAKIFDDQSKP
jgi:hypothetical protein